MNILIVPSFEGVPFSASLSAAGAADSARCCSCRATEQVSDSVSLCIASNVLDMTSAVGVEGGVTDALPCIRSLNRLGLLVWPGSFLPPLPPPVSMTTSATGFTPIML